MARRAVAVPQREVRRLTFEDAVAAAFALGAPAGEAFFAARGELGRVWRLDTERGTWAVKELFVAQDPADAAADVAFQQAARRAGVTAPRPILAVGGSPLAEAEGRQVRVYEWHDLRPDAGPPSPGEAGAVLARIHGLRWPCDGPPHPWYVEAVPASAWTELVAAAHRAGAPWAAAVEAVVPDVLAADHLIGAPPAGRLFRCHLDFNLDNVVLDATGRTVVVDWENSGPADPEQEVAFCLFEFAVDDDAAGRAFVEGYRGAGGTFDPDGIGVFGLTFAVQAHLLELFVRRALGEARSEEDRQRAVEAIADKLRAPLTLVRAERLLAAVP